MSTSSVRHNASTGSKRASSNDQPDSPWAFYFLMGTLGLGLLAVMVWMLIIL